jgi:hypothetical protein
MVSLSVSSPLEELDCELETRSVFGEDRFLCSHEASGGFTILLAFVDGGIFCFRFEIDD